MALRENVADNIDRVFDKIAAAASIHVRFPEAVEDCVRIVAEKWEAKPTFSELGKIMGPRVRNDDQVYRKCAWVAQHFFGERVNCVGNYLVFRRRVRHKAACDYRYESPVAEQLRLLGIATADVDPGPIYHRMDELGAGRRLGGVAVIPEAKQIIVIGGLSYSQSKRLDSSIRTMHAGKRVQLPLFGQYDDRPVSNASISSATGATLQVASDFIQQLAPSYTVVPVGIICGDVGISWHHQVHDLSSFDAKKQGARRVSLDDYPLVYSSIDAIRSGRDYEQLPPQMLVQEVLRAAPVDRATRAYMALSILFDYQQASPGKLVGLSAAEISAEIASRYAVVFSRDLRRHDLEDCLEKSGYIEELLYSPGQYAITHRGVGRLCMLFASAAIPGAASDQNIRDSIVSWVMKQGARWDSYCFGTH